MDRTSILGGIMSFNVPSEASEAAFEVDPDNGADEPDEQEVANYLFAQRLVEAAYFFGLEHYLIREPDVRA
jgi:hypothetical protein